MVCFIFCFNFLWKEILFFLYFILIYVREIFFKLVVKGYLYYDYLMVYNSYFLGNIVYNLFVENIWKIVCSYSDVNLCLM